MLTDAAASNRLRAGRCAALRRTGRRAWRTAATAVLLALAAASSGCYLLQAAAGQADVLRRRQPLEQVIERPATAPALRSRLEYARDARRFASAQLALPDNASYRSYAELGRPYVAWNVFAARELSVAAKQWCFPIAGCVSYRGYFDEARARAYAARLAKRGYDTYVGPVPAYSTLGHFDDPLLDTMLRYDDLELAALIFHELAHQLAYAPSDTDFNESFATVVEYEGVRRWLESRGEPARLQQFLERRQRQQAIAQLLLGTRQQLDRLYASTASDADKRAGKAQAFARLRGGLAGLQQRWGPGVRLDELLQAEFNNARLAAVATYQGCVPAFEALLAREQRDLPRFYAAVHRLAGAAAARRAHCRDPA